MGQDNWLAVEDQKIEAVEKIHKQMMINQSVANVINGVRDAYRKIEEYNSTDGVRWSIMRGGSKCSGITNLTTSESIAQSYSFTGGNNG